MEHRAAIFQQATARFCCPLSEDEKQKSANLVWRGEDGLPDLETTTPCARDRHNLLTQIIIGHIYKKRTKKNKKTWTHPHFGNTHKSSMGTQKIKSGMDTQEKIMDTPETQRNHRHKPNQIMEGHTQRNHGRTRTHLCRLRSFPFFSEEEPYPIRLQKPVTAQQIHLQNRRWVGGGARAYR